jgi:hypothetical protein
LTADLVDDEMDKEKFGSPMNSLFLMDEVSVSMVEAVVEVVVLLMMEEESSILSFFVFFFATNLSVFDMMPMSMMRYFLQR